MRARICIITTVHPPFDLRIFGKQAVSLARAGFDVVLIAQHAKREVCEGVRLEALGRSRSRLSRILFLGWRALFAGLRTHAAVYHLHDPELLWIGLALRAIGKRVIYDAHEDLPEQILAKSWISRPLRRIVSWLVKLWLRLVLPRMSGVIAATDGVADALRLPVRPTVVKNYPVLDLIPPAAARRDDQTARVIYLGQVSEDRGALEMIDAMRALADCRTELILMGSTSGSVASLLERSRPDTAVTVIPWKPPREAYEVLARADIGLVCLHPLPRFQTALPVKLFEYMAAGIPVVASDFPLWSEIVDGAACGLLVDPLDASAIAGAIRYLVDHPEERSRMGKNGRAAVEERCNWEHEAAKLLDLYSQIFGEARGRKRA